MGNQILKEIAAILQRFIRKDEYCSRIADDRFVLYTKNIDIDTIKERIAQLDDLFVKMQHEKFPDIKITIICGIYISHDPLPMHDVLDRANIARRMAKGSFQNTYEFFNQGLESLSEQEKNLEKRTQLALEQREFIPFLQPKFLLSTNQICGAEALARWQSSDRMINPGEFIPIFEKNGFVTTLDFEIYDHTLAFIRESLDKGYTLVPISLNVSRGHVNDDHFLDKFMALMEKYRVPTHLIELELTESIFSQDNDRLRQFILDIQAQNIQVSIDDFGSAYSSLTLLKDVDVDTVKLDKAFIDDITSNLPQKNKKDKIIIENIINMIQDSGCGTISEGIETYEQLAFLRSTGCERGQGYIFSKPVSLAEFETRYLIPTLRRDEYL